MRPPPRLRFSAWIEQHLLLPDGVSALPGPVRLWPYQRAIADAIGDPAIECVGSARRPGPGVLPPFLEPAPLP